MHPKMISKIVFFLACCLPFLGQTQFIDDFSDGDFSTNPTWQGNTENFIINGNNELQLFDADTSNTISTLWTNVPPADSASWEFKIQLNFSPSNSNFAKVYLTSNSSDLDESLNGYYLKIGGITGSDDALELYRQTGSTSSLILSGQAGAVGNDPVLVGIKVERNASGEWQLLTDYSGGNNYSLETSATDNTHPMGDYFGIVCKYTSTRIDKFFFDDFQIGPLFMDTTAPQIESVLPISSLEVDVLFNEAIAPVSVTTVAFSIDNGISIATATLDASQANMIHLILDDELQNNTNYTLSINGIADLSNNTVTNASSSFTYFNLSIADPFDILINEFMADPTPQLGMPNAEFVELYNRSNKVFNLEGFGIASGGSPESLPSFLLQPNSYVVLCEAAIANEFAVFGDVLALNDLPSLTNTADVITLTDDMGNIIHEINYTDDWYQDPAKDDGGWTLELINPSDICTAGENWRASESLSGGTPSMINSVFVNSIDDTPPTIVSVFPINDFMLQVDFSEIVDESTAEDLSNYSLDNGIAVGDAFIEPSGKSVVLELNSALQEGISYTLQANGLADCLGNISSNAQIFTFALPSLPIAKDIIINEILFNPETNGVDYVELYNRSDKVIDLQNLVIANIDQTGEDLEVIASNYLFYPDSYVVLTSDTLDIATRFFVENPSALVPQNLPSFNNDTGNVTLYLPFGGDPVILDAFNYNESYHNALLDDENGVALERLSPDLDSQSPSNWHSAAATVGFGTPTAKNSQFTPTNTSQNTVFTIEEITFSPDGDGFNDFLLLKYVTEGLGFTSNIRIFDARGRLVKTLVQNELLGREGIIKWDGDLDDGSRARIGIYIIWMELFSPDGVIQNFKEECVVARRLE